MVNAAQGDQYRYNWNTPFQLSSHNSSVMWLGGNRLFSSYDRGETWIASADVTKQFDRNTVDIFGVKGSQEHAVQE